MYQFSLPFILATCAAASKLFDLQIIAQLICQRTRGNWAKPSQFDIYIHWRSCCDFRASLHVSEMKALGWCCCCFAWADDYHSLQSGIWWRKFNLVVKTYRSEKWNSSERLENRQSGSIRFFKLNLYRICRNSNSFSVFYIVFLRTRFYSLIYLSFLNFPSLFNYFIETVFVSHWKCSNFGTENRCQLRLFYRSYEMNFGKYPWQWF